MTTSASTKTHAVCPLCGGGLAERYDDVKDRLGTSTDTYRVDECMTCGLGLINPAPSGDLSAFYPDHYLSQEPASGATSLVSRLEQRYRYNQYRFDFRLLEKAAGIQIGDSVSYLDVGCGSGERVTYVSARGCARSVGIDRYDFGKRQSHANVELINTEIVDYRPSERFRVVSMFHVLEHVEEPVVILRHLCSEILEPDGVLVVQVPNYGSIERKLLGRRWFGLDAPRHLFQFDAATTRRAVEGAGLEVVQIYEVNAPLHPVTLVPSFLPALDVQRIWVRPGSAFSKLALQALWAVATVVAIPLAWLQNRARNASMLTVVARPQRPI